MNPYQVGGALNPDDPTYVYRQADIDLLELLEKGQYCYILNSRQMGKSSLAKKARQSLKEKNIISAIIDLSDISSDATREKWYNSVANRMMRSIQESKQIPNFQWKDYWRDLKLSFDVKDCLGELIEKVLTLIPENLVIFLDEIDSLILRSFNTDDLLTHVRYCWNNPNNIPILKRLTFCIIGVRRPDSLIQNESITPFNIGQAVELKGFTVQEAEPLNTISLQEKLGDKENSDIVLKTIIELWTNGQPFLTQKLCKLLLEKDETLSSDIPSFIENFVKKYVIQNWVSNDHPPHLVTIRKRILDDERQAVALLDIYKDILIKGAIEANDSLEQTELRLSGLVFRKEGYLKPFNRIYKEVFNLDWVNEQLANIKPYAEKFEAWLGANEEIKQRYLLYGKELEYALKWREGKNIKNNEYQTFLFKSQAFRQKFIERFPFNPDHFEDTNEEQVSGEDNPKYCTQEQLLIVTGVILGLTGGVLLLNNYIFSKAKQTFQKAIPRGEEQSYIEDRLIPKLLKEEKVKKHLQKIESEIINYTDPFLILSKYREILEQEEINFNDSPEHQKLTDMYLIIKEDNKLKIINKIYPLLFDRGWFDRTLKDITTDLVNKIWLSTTEEDKSDKSQAVKIVIKFNSQLKGKTNPLYGFIQKVLEHTASDRDLLEKLLEKACEQENIPSEQQDKWIEEQLRLLKPNDISQEILAWIKSYEKAIVARNPHYSKAKEIIDIAFCELVEQLSKKFPFRNYRELQNSNIDTVMQYCIEYLAKDLIWNEDETPKPIIDNSTKTKNELRIEVKNCSYKEECEWAKDEPAFVDQENEEEKYKKYRCQRLGCCVGAVKKYMKDNNLPEEQIKKVNYIMETVIETTEEDMNAGIKCKCIGLISIN
ncbi:MAG: AAA-like domain-containing protein [Phormidium sp.]